MFFANEKNDFLMKFIGKGVKVAVKLGYNEL